MPLNLEIRQFINCKRFPITFKNIWDFPKAKPEINNNQNGIKIENRIKFSEMFEKRSKRKLTGRI